MAMPIRPHGAKEDAVKYILLLKYTEAGCQQSPAQSKSGQRGISRMVQKEKGHCQLYQTRGGAYDFVSIIDGLSPAGAIRIVAEIERRGTIRVTLLAGLAIFDRP